MTRHFPASLLLALTLTAVTSRSQTPSKIYVGFEQKTVMTEYTMEGQPTNTFVLSAMAPTGAIVTNDGKIYVSQYGNPSFSFQLFDPAGHPTSTHIPKFLGQTYSIGLSSSGNIYFGSESDGIFYFTPSGKRVAAPMTWRRASSTTSPKCRGHPDGESTASPAARANLQQLTAQSAISTSPSERRWSLSLSRCRPPSVWISRSLLPSAARRCTSSSMSASPF